MPTPQTAEAPLRSHPSAPPTPVTRSQHDRVARILDTTLEILDEVGPAGLQVRDVSKRANVALATLYRYFPSKDFLVASALNHWSSGLAGRLSAPERRRRTEGRQLEGALASVVKAFASHPHYAAAAVVAASSPDPLVPAVLEAHQASFGAGLDAVLGDLPEAHRADVRFIIESVLIAQLVGFSSGRSTPGEMEAALRRAVRVLDLGDTP